jgi:hypothetical protein
MPYADKIGNNGVDTTAKRSASRSRNDKNPLIVCLDSGEFNSDMKQSSAASLKV